VKRKIPALARNLWTIKSVSWLVKK